MGENTHQNCTRQNKNKEDPGRQQPCWGFLFCTKLTQPTRGLDIGASQYVHDTMIEARDKGCGILLISADFDEVLKLSDRILVMFEGQVMGIYSGENPPVEEISLAMAGKEE
mgnify:CR=1 FL=1